MDAAGLKTKTFSNGFQESRLETLEVLYQQQVARLSKTSTSTLIPHTKTYATGTPQRDYFSRSEYR